MQTRQIIGWNAQGEKVLARHAEQARDRGAIGQLWRERSEWNVKHQREDWGLEPVHDHATA